MIKTLKIFFRVYILTSNFALTEFLSKACKVTMEHENYRTKSDPCSLEHLVDSHFILLRLVKETNEVLGGMIGSYFGTQVNHRSIFVET